MQTISINAVAAAHTVASVIEGFGEPVLIEDRETGVTCAVRPCGEFADYVELNLQAADGSGARVSLERPRRAFGGALQPAQVTWPSSGRSDARSMSRLLEFAVRVAEQLDSWAAAGQLPRLNVDEQTGEPVKRPTGETPLQRRARLENEAIILKAEELAASDPQVGDLVDIAIYAPGPGGPQRPVGHLRGYVVVAGIEYNVGLIDDEEDVEQTLLDAEVRLGDLPESDGSVVPAGTPILENCQREWLTVVERSVKP